MFLTPSFKKSLIVEQFHGNYLKLSNLGRFSNDDSDAETDVRSKMNFYFTSEIRDFIELFSAPTALKTFSDQISNYIVQFEIKNYCRI